MMMMMMMMMLKITKEKFRFYDKDLIRKSHRSKSSELDDLRSRIGSYCILKIAASQLPQILTPKAVNEIYTYCLFVIDLRSENIQ